MCSGSKAHSSTFYWPKAWCWDQERGSTGFEKSFQQLPWPEIYLCKLKSCETKSWLLSGVQNQVTRTIWYWEEGRIEFNICFQLSIDFVCFKSAIWYHMILAIHYNSHDTMKYLGWRRPSLTLRSESPRSWPAKELDIISNSVFFVAFFFRNFTSGCEISIQA